VSDFSHLWNDLPFSERARLMPYMMETHKRHVMQCKQRAVNAHKRHMKELNSLIAELDREIDKAKGGE